MFPSFSRRQFLTQTSAGVSALGLNAIMADMAFGQALRQSLSGQDPRLWSGDERSASGDAPITISTVTLRVNNLDLVGDFYQSALGLSQLAGDGEAMVLGAGQTPLLILQKDRNARRYPFEAGLFHTAFLMPDRAALGRWLQFAAQSNLRLTGAADHHVSEALYLDDPEGNGIEIYADRPSDHWQTEADGQLRMGSYQLDLDGIARSADGNWSAAPEDMIIGHVHLQVGDVAQSHAFMTQELGQNLMRFSGSAGFYASGGYHHHFAGNIWNSQGAGRRSANSTGLHSVAVKTDGTRLQPGRLTDPWGTHFDVSQA